MRIRNAFNQNKVPLVLQYEMVECGAASLSMILRYFGKYLSMNELRYQCGVSRDGSNLLNIKKAAISFGLDAFHDTPRTEDILSGKVCFPCIAWWNYNHFVVLEGIQNSTYVKVVDPANGRYRVAKSELEECFSGYILQFKRTNTFIASGKPERELLRFIPELLNYKSAIVFLALTTLSLLVTAILSPAISGAFVQDFLTDHRYGFGVPVIWMSLLIIFLESGLRWSQFSAIRNIALTIQRKLSLSIAIKLLEVDYSFYSSRFIGDIAGRLGLANNVSNTIVNELLVFALSLSGAFLIMPFIILISWQLMLFTAAYIIVSSLLSMVASAYSVDANRSIELQSGKISGITVRILSDTRTIKSSGLESEYLNAFQDFYAPIHTKSHIVQSTMNLLLLANTFTNSLYNYGTIALSGYLVMKGSMNLASFMAFQVLRSEVTTPLISVASMITQVQQAEAELGRLQDLRLVHDDPKVRSLQVTELTDARLDLTRLPESRMAASRQRPTTVELENVSLSFSPRSANVLTDVSFQLSKSEMLTIVGPSGSGKSCLIKVIAGLYNQTAGKVTYDNKEWLEYADDCIRSSISYVQQDSTIYSGTVMDNLTDFSDRFTLDDVRLAAKSACIDGVLMDLPQGYLTRLGPKGVALSGGQMQRLQLARALLSNPSIIILDEATSALDIPTETQVLSNIKALGITTICVAHRLIAAHMSDLVIVLKAGKVIEIGSPSVLMKQSSSFYSDLLAADSK